MLAFIRWFFVALNLVFVFAFLGSCLAPFISPRTFWPVAFLGLGFLPLLAANICWIFFWLLFKRKFALFSAMALMVGSWNISNHFGFSMKAADPADVDFSVLSFNVKVFDLYDWNHNTASKDSILSLIDKNNADVVCLQEFYTDHTKHFNIIDRLKSRYPYFHFKETFVYETYHRWGIITFSKFPIVGRGVVEFEDSKQHAAIASDIVVNHDTIRIFNTHLQSIYFNKDDFEGITQLEEGKAIEPAMKITGKLWTAFIKRAGQAELLAENIAQSPYKVVLCGDFNDTPNSYTYRLLSKGRTDSFKKKGFGIGHTYSGPIPVMRIDYILADKRLSVVSHHVMGNALSDHHAVRTSFSLE